MTKQELDKFNQLLHTIENLEKLVDRPLDISAGIFKLTLDLNESEMLEEIQEVLKKHLKAKKEMFDSIKFE